MTTDLAPFWKLIIANANADPVFVERTRHLEACVLLFRVDAENTFIEFHRGEAHWRGPSFLRGASISVTGPGPEWTRLLDGDIHYMQAINPLHGKLRLEGDYLMANWAARGICRFLDLAVAHRRVASHA